MNRKKTLLMVVVFPGIIQFLRDYLRSVNIQTDREFNLLILSDQLEYEYFEVDSDNCTIINIAESLSPAEIRLVGIKYAVKQDYHYLIFSDADDFFSSNRIEASVATLKHHDFVFNDINLVNIKGDTLTKKYLSFIGAQHQYNDYKNIINYNMFGMSNAGVRAHLLKDFYIPEDIIAVDWWIFTFLLLNGAKGKFINEATTFYRQTNNNTVGMNKKLNEQRLSFGISVKTRHYKNVLSYCINNKLDFATRDYSDKLEEMKELSEAIKDAKFKKLYIDAVNENFDQIYKGWWSEILPLKDWGKYAK